MFFDKELSFFQAEFNSKEEALGKMADLLRVDNLVNEDFQQKILDRESIFPTGLPTLPYGVAIPHTDPEQVRVQQIVFASLKNPVTFKVMGSSGEEVRVKIIFMLALKSPEEHLGILQALIELLQNPSVVERLGRCKDQGELNAVLNAANLK
nr:PTS sugar transporter subunit IIA [Neobacillus sp. Marseille-Q6967]